MRMNEARGPRKGETAACAVAAPRRRARQVVAGPHVRHAYYTPRRGGVGNGLALAAAVAFTCILRVHAWAPTDHMAVDHVLVDTGGTISRGDWTCLSGCDTDTTTWPVVWDYSSGDYSLPASKLSNGAFASPFLEVHSALSMFIVVAAAPTSMVMACDLDECSATSRMGLRACSLGINARASTLDKSTSPPRMVLVEDFGDRRAALAYLEFSELEPYDPTSGTTPKSCSFSDGYDATVGVMNAIHAGSSGEIYYTYEYPQDSNHYGLYMVRGAEACMIRRCRTCCRSRSSRVASHFRLRICDLDVAPAEICEQQ